MSELLKKFAVRAALPLTPKQIDSIGFKSHPDLLQSNRYKAWLKICESDRYTDLVKLMKEFLEGNEPIRSMNQITPELKKLIEFANYNGFEFTKEEFLSQVDLNKLSIEFKKIEERGDSNFLNVYSNFADQLIAEAIVSSNAKKNNLDKQAILKTLILIEKIYILRKEKVDINFERFYAKPIILPPCFFKLDPCKAATPVHNPATLSKQTNIEKNITPNNEKPEPDCGCGKVPEKDDCDCKCDETCVPQNPCCVEIIPYIADLYVVKDEISYYEAGEMSYIENILESEIRERIHRSFEREEINTEHEEETTNFEQKDHQIDERFSLQKEIDKTIEQTISVDAGVTAHQEWGTGDVTATTNVGFNQSKKDAQKSVQDSAKQVISKSITSLQKKIRDFSSRKLIKEMEEINKHSFGGTTGAIKDISRQFYYVNQVRKGQVYNYGKRSLLDFYLPEPSELYKRLIEKRFSQKKPEKPCITIGEISADKYLEYIKCYGLKDIEFPPKEKIDVKGRMNGRPEPKDKIGIPGYKVERTGQYDDNGSISIPEGYESISLDSYINALRWNDNYNPPGTSQDIFGGVSLTASINGHMVEYYPNPSGTHDNPIPTTNISLVNCPEVEGTPAIILKTWDVTEYDITFTLHCKLKAETLLKWQLPIYFKIMEAYEKELAAYNEALAEFERTKQIKYKQNPFILLQDIQEQLKQAAISYISCQFFDDMNAMKHKVKDCGLPQFDIPEAKKEGEFVRFFEQAFEWKFMNFMLYPYFWSRKCTWEDKMNEEADNMLFQRFLKAGYARVSVSVRRGFEGHVDYFLATRKIWGSTGIPPIAGPAFVPIYQEIKEDKENFNVDKVGSTIDVVNLSRDITVNGTDEYYDIVQAVEDAKIALDIDREIFINCKQYRIVKIIENPLSLPTVHTSWIITLDRPYEGADAQNLPWSTGAKFVGAPWEFKVPTRLVWLRSEGGCLPDSYPIKCK
jgi:hypothetical protein